MQEHVLTMREQQNCISSDRRRFRSRAGARLKPLWISIAFGVFCATIVPNSVVNAVPQEEDDGAETESTEAPYEPRFDVPPEEDWMTDLSIFFLGEPSITNDTDETITVWYSDCNSPTSSVTYELEPGETTPTGGDWVDFILVDDQWYKIQDGEDLTITLDENDQVRVVPDDFDPATDDIFSYPWLAPTWMCGESDPDDYGDSTTIQEMEEQQEMEQEEEEARRAALLEDF
ncbi:MAG: hypothetical protein IH991_15180 [Planctomycetes bacterium]|nr:hypothetical protein [Planctomycetota bacterium]